MRLPVALLTLALVAVAFTARPLGQTARTVAAAPGEILVAFHPGVAAAAKADTHRANGGRVLSEIARTGVQRVAVPRGGEAAAIDRYARNPNVRFAEPNFIRRIPTNSVVEHAGGTEVLPADYYFAEQWALHNTGQFFVCIPWIDGTPLCFYVGTPDADIDAPEAWALSTGNPVTVAVIDSGVDYTHPDIAPNYDGGDDFLAPDGDPMDDLGHGTHVAGTIAAALNNPTGSPAAEEGVVGVAPHARIRAYKVCDVDGHCDDFAIQQAVARAIQDGARVINMSLGGPEVSASLDLAIQDAWDSGLVIVAGAGNDGTTRPFYPAAYDHVVSVGAFDEDHRRATFSNYGSWVDLSAPGNVIISSYPMSTCTATSTPGDTGCYTWASGTSMATPHVSGAAALVWSRADVTTNQQVVDILLGSADPVGVDPVRLDTWTTHGGLNIHGAMSFGVGNRPPIAAAGPDQVVTDLGGDLMEAVALDGTLSSDPEGGVLEFEWLEGTTTIATGASASVVLSAGSHTLTLKVTDPGGASGTDTVLVVVNRPPVADAGSDHTVVDTDGDGTELVALNGLGSVDPDGTVASYSWFEGSSVIATGPSPTVALSVGVHAVTLVVTDNHGALATDGVVVTVSAPALSTVHVGDLDGTTRNTKRAWAARVVVTVHNAAHQPVSGAVVTGTWTGATATTVTCTTTSNGTCSVDSGDVRRRAALAEFTVTNVAAVGASYSPGLNHEPDGDSTGTSITLRKP